MSAEQLSAGSTKATACPSYSFKQLPLKNQLATFSLRHALLHMFGGGVRELAGSTTLIDTAATASASDNAPFVQTMMVIADATIAPETSEGPSTKTTRRTMTQMIHPTSRLLTMWISKAWKQAATGQNKNDAIKRKETDENKDQNDPANERFVSRVG